MMKALRHHGCFGMSFGMSGRARRMRVVACLFCHAIAPPERLDKERDGTRITTRRVLVAASAPTTVGLALIGLAMCILASACDSHNARDHVGTRDGRRSDVEPANTAPGAVGRSGEGILANPLTTMPAGGVPQSAVAYNVAQAKVVEPVAVWPLLLAKEWREAAEPLEAPQAPASSLIDLPRDCVPPSYGKGRVYAVVRAIGEWEIDAGATVGANEGQKLSGSQISHDIPAPKLRSHVPDGQVDWATIAARLPWAGPVVKLTFEHKPIPGSEVSALRVARPVEADIVFEDMQGNAYLLGIFGQMKELGILYLRTRLHRGRNALPPGLVGNASEVP